MKTAELVAQTQKTEFEAFYREYYSKVLFYLTKRIGNRAEAEDLAGDVFLYCYQRFDEYDPRKSALSSWLFLIANSRLKNYFRDRKQHCDIGELENYLYAENDEMEKAVYLEQLRNKISDCLSLLPERNREILIMRHFRELSFQEIGDALGISAGNARVILSRTLDKMERELNAFLL